ncbi:MAG: glycoside hydrolase family 38 C-terminal domain-containing protein [Planctomycetota bacterium]
MVEKKIHLVCNAHLDPVWLWEWEEGAAEAMSTFRTAADLCEEFDGFVFNHNEAVLYKWVEEYEPALFRRIQRLVKERKWHIMGGWYLQPDCNMPSGESFVRQILLGRRYFKEKFGEAPTTAINFDPFGHTRGLAQILAKSGYDSYLFCRPGQKDCPLPRNEFVWVGYDGSEIVAKRSDVWYNSPLGGARAKVENWIKGNPDRASSLILWGVGNHGGGPSRKDVQDLQALIRETRDFAILHSTPEDYFRDLRRDPSPLPRRESDMNPWAVGCYTSMVRVKQQHRRLENEIYACEKMASAATIQGLMRYPKAELHEALCDLMVSEFHDVLPGSSIQPVEEASLRMMDHGLEIVSRLKARTFFALAGGQPRAKAGEIPILIYNPHPFRVKGVFECEFQLADQNWTDTYTLPVVHRDGKPLPCQVEKELGNLTLDWRKRVVFAAELEPSRMNRFDCRVQSLPRKPTVSVKERRGALRFRTADLDVIVNTRTGFVDRCRIGGKDCLGRNAFQPVVLMDNEDPWGMGGRRFDREIGRFKRMSREAGARFSGVTAGPIPSVRVIEDGDVRTVVEAVLSYESSAICQRYKLPKRGAEIEVEVRVHWNEKDRMLKLRIPTSGREQRYIGQVAYGVGDLPANGDEAVAQKWVAVVSRRDNRALTCINDGVYGSDFSAGVLRLTLLRSPAYSGHPIKDRPIVMQDRYTPRIDQGERIFRFWINSGRCRQRLDLVDREALAKNEKPFALSFFPSGAGKKTMAAIVLSDPVVQCTAVKQAEDNDDLIIRLFEPTGRKRSTVVSIPALRQKRSVQLSGFEIKTLRASPRTRRLEEADLLT